MPAIIKKGIMAGISSQYIRKSIPPMIIIAVISNPRIIMVSFINAPNILIIVLTTNDVIISKRSNFLEYFDESCRHGERRVFIIVSTEKKCKVERAKWKVRKKMQEGALK